MCMFYVISRFSLLGIRKIVMAAEGFLAAWGCVLRKNGFIGLRERFKDNVIFSLFNYVSMYFSALSFVNNFN